MTLKITEEKKKFNTLKLTKTTILMEHAEALKVYREFKRIRKEIGKPVTTEIDPNKILSDLKGEDFFTLIEQLKSQKSIGEKKKEWSRKKLKNSNVHWRRHVLR